MVMRWLKFDSMNGLREKNTIKNGLILTVGVLIASFSLSSHSALNEDKLQSFCQETSLFVLFDTPQDQCLEAAKICADQARFRHLDDELSEPFYQCVFKKLDIEVN